MTKLIAWIKANKLPTFLLLVIFYLLLKNSYLPFRQLTSTGGAMKYSMDYASSLGPGSLSNLTREAAPAPEVEDRLVIKQSTISLLVKKVNEVQKSISQKAQQLDGYLVDSNVSYPEQVEAASGSISVRIPQAKLDEALDYFRTLAIKVVSENLSGQDVTDEYVDIDARLATLNKTKIKFEEILAKAEKIDDILQVQRELINLQQQIDNLKGQQNYLEKNAQMSKITVYLSTDELALPYAPSEAWRPAVIFKQAIRSLVKMARKIGTGLIWIAVYSVIWIPALVIYRFLRWRKRNTSS